MTVGENWYINIKMDIILKHWTFYDVIFHEKFYDHIRSMWNWQLQINSSLTCLFWDVIKSLNVV
jgi:hypothetical protein